MDKLEGVIYGLALGDAMGMPPELWGRKKALKELGKITGFLDGPMNNPVAKNYVAGQYTDDTGQAFVILDSLKESNYKVEPERIALNLLKWADENDAFENNILGPTSKAALNAVKEGKDTVEIASAAETNGAAMRIGPVGALFGSEKGKDLCKYIYNISKITHSSDVAVEGACLIGMSVSNAIELNSAKEGVEASLELADFAKELGHETFSPSIGKRTKFYIEYLKENQLMEDEFLDFVYEIVGAGVNSSESVTAALLCAWYSNDPNVCALLCANLGGDTDTIGAMATAICGGATGLSGIKKEYIDKLNEANEVDFSEYINILAEGRKING